MPRINVFSLRGHVRPENSGDKGTSAEGKNIDILRENIDIFGEISICIDTYGIDIFAITMGKISNPNQR